MDIALVPEKLKLLFKQNWLPLALGLLGLMLFMYGLISFLGSASNKTDTGFAPAKTASDIQPTQQVNSQKIVVDIEGAVVKPGIYSLALSSRVQDVLISASGLSETADRNWIEKNLNLAAKLSDGAKIYIPRLGEVNPPVGRAAAGSVQGVSVGEGITETSSLINVNTATSTELDGLPGVGPVTAEKIISNRPYSSVDELLSKKAVNNKVFAQIKDKVVAN